jgi:glycosyltransferase involved in cell wall biosynthesis
MPKVSVIIPNYNHARFLRQRIDSVLGQTYQNFELILLDDCSTDESRSIIGECADDPRIRMEFNEKNSGSSFKQWNKGVRLAGGEYVWIAESDDYADERLLERLVSILDAEPEVTFAYCRSWRVDEKDQKDGFGDWYLDGLDPDRWKADFRADGAEECRKYFMPMNPVPNASAVVFRKSAYERAGGADEGLRMCGDWKLWAAMALGGRIAYLGEPLNYHRFHDASVRSQSLQGRVDVTEILQVIRWILSQITLTEDAREKMCDGLSCYWIPAALNRRIAFSRRLAILRYAKAVDRHALRKFVCSALVALRMTLSRRYRSVRFRF